MHSVGGQVYYLVFHANHLFFLLGAVHLFEWVHEVFILYWHVGSLKVEGTTLGAWDVVVGVLFRVDGEG